mmetsp:Transcript_107415/g.310439  ORF Transcript_107415/g.310439 Transcript_107415/m.310439 type:complete len:219 (+) Transcript_107415:512-1168(+)
MVARRGESVAAGLGVVSASPIDGRLAVPHGRRNPWALAPRLVTEAIIQTGPRRCRPCYGHTGHTRLRDGRVRRSLNSTPRHAQSCSGVGQQRRDHQLESRALADGGRRRHRCRRGDIDLLHGRGLPQRLGDVRVFRSGSSRRRDRAHRGVAGLARGGAPGRHLRCAWDRVSRGVKRVSASLPRPGGGPQACTVSPRRAHPRAPRGLPAPLGGRGGGRA